ncbi:MAG: hypothetical protein NZ580_06800 [Bacteroidia bacterium]|nr:hypothetical protein [Bacteroidia bacterium]MDW8236371.1 hypothetical protein [Bacteroidia bacterium]
MRRVALGLTLLLILIIGTVWMHKQFMQPPRRPAPWQNVPSQYYAALYAPSFAQFWKSLRYTPMQAPLLATALPNSPFPLAQTWDSLLHAIPELFSWFYHRPVLVSFYPEGVLYLLHAPELGKVPDWRSFMHSLQAKYSFQANLITRQGFSFWQIGAYYITPAGEILACATHPDPLIRLLSGDNLTEISAFISATHEEGKDSWLLLHFQGPAWSSRPLWFALLNQTTLSCTLEEEALVLQGFLEVSSSLWEQSSATSASGTDLCPATTQALLIFRVQAPTELFHTAHSALQEFASYLSGEVLLLHTKTPLLLLRLRNSEGFMDFWKKNPATRAPVQRYKGFAIYRWDEAKLKSPLLSAFFQGKSSYLLPLGEWIVVAPELASLRQWIESYLSRRSLYMEKDFPAPSPIDTFRVFFYLRQPFIWLPPLWQAVLAPWKTCAGTLETKEGRLYVRLRLFPRVPDTLIGSLAHSPSTPILPRASDTLKQGVQEEYYPNGVVKKRAMYVDGVLEGEYWEFHPNGVVRVQGYYEQGQKVGKWRYYSSKGELLRQEVWSEEEFMSSEATR